MTQNHLDILFISPSFQPLLKEESIGTLILALKAKLAEYSVQVLRYWEDGKYLSGDYILFRDSFVEKIIQKNPTIVSFYCRCTDYHVSLDIAKNVKQQRPNSIILFAGPQATLVSIDTLKQFDFVDYVACSEGENTIVPFLNYILYHKGLANDIPGLCYRTKDGGVIQNEFPRLLKNDYIREYYYYDLIPSSIIPKSTSLTLDVGRGCPFSCVFCSTKTFWKQQFRLRDIDDILKEMKWIVANLGISKFDFDHDMFTANKSKLKKFCNAIHEYGLDVKWYCSSRLDTISPEEIDYMADAGMTNILFGVETGSPRMQKLINKNLDLARSRDIIRYAVSKGVKAKVSFMYGFPEENEDDFEETLRLMVDIQRMGGHAIIWRCGILNGTALYEKYKDELVFSNENIQNYSFLGFKENIELIKVHPTIFPHFYDYPNPLRKTLVYFDLFFSLWNEFERKCFDEVSDYYLQSNRNLLDMYRLFVYSNSEILQGYIPTVFDKFWGLSKNECSVLVQNFVEAYKRSSGKI